MTEWRLTREQMNAYLQKLETEGCSPATIQAYQNDLMLFYQALPADKSIRAETVKAWQQQLAVKGYRNSSVRRRTSAVNGLLNYCGHRELQAETPAKKFPVQPELTREEYLRLLSVARLRETKREYLIIKVLGSTGLSVGELSLLTAKAAAEGRIITNTETLYIPSLIQEELLSFLSSEGIISGPVFRAKNGSPINRTVVTKQIQQLGRAAGISSEKTTPRCLKKMCQTTKSEIYADFSFLMKKAYDRLLETEQRMIGWEK